MPPFASQSPPRDVYERAISAVFRDVLGIDDCGIHDDFFELGGRSLVAVRLVDRLRTLYGVDLGLAVLLEAPTVELLAKLVRERLGSAGGGAANARPAHASSAGTPPSRCDTPSLVPIQSKGDKPPLFLVHGWGGNVIGFAALSRHLGQDQPVYGLQSVGLDGQRVPYTRIDEIACHFIDEMRVMQPVGPYLLGGYSFGGIVAFEMAHQLRRMGHDVALLAVLDTRLDRLDLAPSSTWTKLANTAGFWYRRVKFHGGRVVLASSAERSEYVKRLRLRLRRRRQSRVWQRSNQIQHVAEQLDAGHQLDLPRAFHVVKEANLAAMNAYEYQPYSGTASFYLAENQCVPGAYDNLANWRYLVPHGLCIHTVPGHQLEILEEPHVRVMAAKITEDIALAEGQPQRLR